MKPKAVQPDAEALERKAFDYVLATGRVDCWIALSVSVLAGVLLTAFPYPALHPDFWGTAAVAVDIRPPESPVGGIWGLLARALYRGFGQVWTFRILEGLGHATGAALAGIAYLLIRIASSARVALTPPELARLVSPLRLFAAIGALVFICSDPVWRQVQMFSNNLFHLFLAAVSLGAFLMSHHSGHLAWYCLTYASAGVLAAESPIGLVIAFGFFILNIVNRVRQISHGNVVKAFGLTNEAMRLAAQKASESGEAAVVFDEASADDPEEFAEEKVAADVSNEANSLENLTFCVFFFTAFFATLLVDAWAFRSLGGMAVRSLGAWDYPVVLFSAWIDRLRNVITPDDFLAASAFSLLPFVVAWVMMPLATDSKSRLSFSTGWLMLFLGIAAWTQLGPIPRFWYWVWDIARSSTPSGMVQTVFAFFGAGTLAMALQTLWCACRQRGKAGAITVVVTRMHAQMRGFGRLVLALVTVGVIVGSVGGRRQPKICECLSLMWEYVGMTVDQVNGARWLFTDGSYDDALMLALKARGEQYPAVISTMSGHAPYEKYLRLRCAQEPDDISMLEVSGAEVLRFWVNEKTESLKASAVQVGIEALRKCRKEHPRTAGLAMRIANLPDEPVRYDKADADTAAFSERVLSVGRKSFGSFEGFDRAIWEKFDFMLWRLARMADQRAIGQARQDNKPQALAQRDLAKKLDAANLSLKLLEVALSRLKPSNNVVLTPREGLEISLKRADFELGQKYAQMVLRMDPMDDNANFAMGMWFIETHAYDKAVVYLSRSLKKRPQEPVILNNLALAKLRAGDVPGAMKDIEAAKGINKTSEEILRNHKEISAAFAKYTEELWKKREK